MLNRTRTQNVSINVVISLLCQFVNLAFSFISRTVFIKTLGVDYLGVNGLFTNVLTILSFAELGIGNSIIFSMYKPLADKDEEKLSSLMDLYRKSYTVIGITVALAGICIVPFIDIIVKDDPTIVEDIRLLYLLFLTNSVCSYCFVHKKSIIIADQRNYLIIGITETIYVLQVLAQIIVLYTTHNFILFLIIQIICTLLGNIASSVLANYLYPFLRKKAVPLEKKESQVIFKNVRALVLYKFGSVILNGTDNILISSLVGVNAVGLVSNYVLLSSSCNKVLQKITEAFTASIGNLNATASPQEQNAVFKKIFLITAWIYGYASVGLATVSQHFISIWIGEEYLLSIFVLLSIIAEFYVKGVHFVASTYRTTLGFFVEGKWSALLAAAINLILSVLLCKVIGLAGILVATPIARILSIGIVDPVMVFHKGFKKSAIEYYRTYIIHLLINIVIGLTCYIVLSCSNIQGVLGVLVDIVVVTILYNLIMLALFYKTKIFRELMCMLKGIIRKRG